MQAVILAGGQGTRLRSLNLPVPKPLVEIAGQPFLTHLLRMLLRRGIADFLFLLGFKSELLVHYLQHSAFRNAAIRWSIEPAPRGTGGALKLAQALLQEQFYLIYGDSFLDIDYGDVARQFLASRVASMMVVYDNRLNTDVPNNVALDAAGHVAQYSKEQRPNACTHVEAGVLAFRKSVLDLIPADTVCSLEKEAFPKLIAMQAIQAYVTDRRFYDIGTPERIREFEEVLRRDNFQDAL